MWIMSIIVSLAPLLGWKDENWLQNVQEGRCMVSRTNKLKMVYSENSHNTVVFMVTSRKQNCRVLLVLTSVLLLWSSQTFVSTKANKQNNKILSDLTSKGCHNNSQCLQILKNVCSTENYLLALVRFRGFYFIENRVGFIYSWCALCHTINWRINQNFSDSQ